MTHEGWPRTLFGSCALALLGMGESFSTQNLQDALEKAERREEMLKHQLHLQRFDPPSHSRKLKRQLDYLVSGIAELFGVLHPPAFGSPYGGAEGPSVAEQHGLVECRHTDCSEVLSKRLAYVTTGLCRRHFALARGLTDPTQIPTPPRAAERTTP
jgi:hypothetical protein